MSSSMNLWEVIAQQQFGAQGADFIGVIGTLLFRFAQEEFAGYCIDFNGDPYQVGGWRRNGEGATLDQLSSRCKGLHIPVPGALCWQGPARREEKDWPPLPAIQVVGDGKVVKRRLCAIVEQAYAPGPAGCAVGDLPVWRTELVLIEPGHGAIPATAFSDLP